MAERGQWRGIRRILRFARPHWLLIALTLGATAAATSGDAAYLALMLPFVSAARKVWQDAQERFEAAFGTKRAKELRALLQQVVTSEAQVDPNLHA